MESNNISNSKTSEANIDTNLLAGCEKVSFSRAGVNVINNIDIHVKKSEILTIVGPNGSGKTTTLKILSGLEKPDSGNVYRKKNLIIGYMPQKISIEQIMPITVRRFLRLNGFSRNLRDIGAIESIANEFGIYKLLGKQIHEISGGEMQRVMLARALLIKPELLVLDEPTQGLDVQGQEEFYRIIENVKHQYHCGILMVSHDLHVVMAKTDRVICLNKHICCQGHPEDISRHPEYLSLFGKKEVGEQFAIYPHKHDHSH